MLILCVKEGKRTTAFNLKTALRKGNKTMKENEYEENIFGYAQGEETRERAEHYLMLEDYIHKHPDLYLKGVETLCPHAKKDWMMDEWKWIANHEKKPYKKGTCRFKDGSSISIARWDYLRRMQTIALKILDNIEHIEREQYKAGKLE
jgi:hypothetical protein